MTTYGERLTTRARVCFRSLAQVKYNEFMHALGSENVCVDRKVLAELAVNEPHSFKALVDQVKRMRGIK